MSLQIGRDVSFISTSWKLRRSACALWIVPFVCALLPAFSRPTAAQTTDTSEVDDRIKKALKYLHLTRAKGGGRTGQHQPAVTALGVMAFLSAGHLPNEGPYGKAIAEDIAHVLKHQRPNGLFAAHGGLEMYHHGICTLMLAEVVGMTEGSMAKKVRGALSKAVAVILKAQRMHQSLARGGWRYTVDGRTSDLSVTGWQLLALKAAHNVGCDVPASRIQAALEFVDRCWAPSVRAYGYLPGGRVTYACTGTAILCMEICGTKRRTQRVLRGGAYLLRQMSNVQFAHEYYGYYYASQAMFQLGGNYWSVFRDKMHKMLLKKQQSNGRWPSNGYGDYYATSMAVLALTVEYRLLPIYQRGSDES